MPSDSIANYPYFLRAEGETARLMREKDWSKTPLGIPASWPQPLKSAVNLLLQSRFPMFISWGKERTFLYNDSYAIILGKKHPKAMGESFFQVWKEIWNDIEPLIQSVDQGKAIYLEDLKLITNRHGFDEETYFTFSYSPMLNENGSVDGLFCSVVETTARKKTEQSLRRSENALKHGEPSLLSEASVDITERKAALDLEFTANREIVTTLETMTEGFFSFDSKFQMTYANYETAKFLSLPKEKIIGKSAEEVFQSKDWAWFRTRFLNIIQTGDPDRFEGAYGGHLLQVHAYRGKDGGVSVFYRDVTEQRKSELDAQESKERYKMIYDQSPLPKLIFDLETLKFVDINETALKHYGYSKDEFLSMTVKQIRPPEDSNLLQDALNQTADFGKVYFQKNVRHVKKDGSIINVELSTHDLILNGRRCRLATVIDVTERVRNESKQRELVLNLKAAKDEAERANQLKSAFLANMSHEIRTPLGAMIGFADLLKDPELSESERSKFIDILVRNGQQLSLIINDILDLSKVEAGHLILEKKECHPQKVTSEVLSLMSLKAHEKGIRLELQMDQSTPQDFTTDPTRFRQILLNLVGNAVKFTNQGSVKLKSYSQRNESGKYEVCFEVSDTGIGVAADQSERIFDMFVQGDDSMTRKFGGTGLGLSLSRKLARALGGDLLLLRTEIGVGSTFLLRLPSDQTQSSQEGLEDKKTRTQQSQDQHPMLQGLRILVVDDAPDNRKLIQRYLNRQGANVETADNGSEGVQRALSKDFDLVLMDIQMPVMDGYSATHELRQKGYEKPILALSAHAMTEIRDKCLAAGYTDHLPKPINSRELFQTIAKYTSQPFKLDVSF